MISKLSEHPIYDESGNCILGTSIPDKREIVNKINEIIEVLNKENENV